jgi:ubiquinone/menaquinone biosynthesis C-methylase UbiE
MKREYLPGDFTNLAVDYSENRPDYSPSVLDALLGFSDKLVNEMDVVDVGAGTGIWTRMVADRGPRTITAIEPNDDMMQSGINGCGGYKINWHKSVAENIPVPDCTADWLTMASSFHWVDFDKATQEFHRVLRPGGYFTALWNPRLIEVNPLLVEIEAKLTNLSPDIKRVSSGRSGVTNTLFERLSGSPYFGDVVYIEGRHVVKMSPDRYVGAWRSVNDLRVQLGSDKFDDFLRYVEARVSNVELIEATYLTRSWSAKRVS